MTMSTHEPISVRRQGIRDCVATEQQHKMLMTPGMTQAVRKKGSNEGKSQSCERDRGARDSDSEVGKTETER